MRYLNFSILDGALFRVQGAVISMFQKEHTWQCPNAPIASMPPKTYHRNEAEKPKNIAIRKTAVIFTAIIQNADYFKKRKKRKKIEVQPKNRS